MTAPERIEPAVQEKSKKAAQNTPFSRAQVAVSTGVRRSSAGAPPMCGPINSFHGSDHGALFSPPVIPGPFCIAKYSHQPTKKNATVIVGISIEFFINVLSLFFSRETPTSYKQKPTWIKNISTTVTQ